LLTRQLVDATFPEFAALLLQPLDATGSSNLQFRLGDEILVRLSRQPVVAGRLKRRRAGLGYWVTACR